MGFLQRGFAYGNRRGFAVKAIVPPTRYEHYIIGDDGRGRIATESVLVWVGMTFTPVIAHRITLVKPKILRVGLPGILYFAIRATSGGLPAGSNLCEGSIDGNTLTLSEGGKFTPITLGEGTPLSAGVKYAMFGWAPTANFDSNYVGWRRKSVGTYGGGNAISSQDYGVSWGSLAPTDQMFEEWGIPL